MSKVSGLFAMAMTAGLLSLGARRAYAQEFRVRLTDAETKAPLGGLLVSTIAAGGEAGSAVLTSADGIAVMRVKGAGSYRLLIRRIGFAPFTSSPFAITAESGGTIDLAVTSQRITLATVQVVAPQTCPRNAESPSAGAMPVWTEVRAALEASLLSRDQRLVRANAVSFQRDLQRDGQIFHTDTTARGVTGDRPFFAPAPATLEKNGYFRIHDDGSEDFYAPDERVLLSDGFTRTHCVSLLAGARRDSTGVLIGLAFMPRDRDTRPEIHGIIWIDSATSELRSVEFEYERISLRAPADSLGGRVEFAHLASGAWIVSAWALRMPRFRMVDRRNNYFVLDGYTEVGGGASVSRDLVLPSPSAPRRIVGSVFDSVTNEPLAGARVHIADLGREATADSLGRFAFDSVTPGVHAVWANHRELDDMGLFSLGTKVDVTPQLSTEVALAVPSFLTLWSKICGTGTAVPAGTGFVYGSVRSDEPSAGATAGGIEVSWRGASSASANSRASVRADSTGAYVLCGVPSNEPGTLSASRGTVTSTPIEVRLGSARISRQELVLPTRAAVDSANAAIGRVEFLSAGDGNPATGATRTLRVIAADGKPVVFANVNVDGGTTNITDQNGEVRLGSGRMKALTVRVRRIGFTQWFGSLSFPDSSSVATLTLTHTVQQLGEIKVTGQKNPSSPFVQGFYDRWMERQKGLLSATFIGPEEIEARHPDQITTMLRGLNGVQFVNTCLGRACLVAMATDTPDCPMAVVIDGHEQMPELLSAPQAPRPIYAVRIDQYVSAHDVMGIEVYARGANMPISLQTKDNRCGVIAFWTGSRR